MAHSYHHAVSSARKCGGKLDDFQSIHDWLASKLILADFRHRALRHHAEGCWMAGVILRSLAGGVATLHPQERRVGHPPSFLRGGGSRLGGNAQ
jgi:hypothetical protein